MPPTLENIAISIDSGAIAIVKFNRPKNANAINTNVLKDMLAALDWCATQPSIRIIVTTGEGKFYTAGLDLLDPINQQPGATISDEFLLVIGKIHEFLIRTDLLVVSAVNGPAPGWGTTSIALSDLVYASDNAMFFTPFVQWGLCAEGCSSSTFIKIMGRQKASALLLAGQKFSAQEAESAGLVTKVFGRGSFMEEVMGVVRGIAKLPPASLKANKRFLMRDLKEGLLRANQEEIEFLGRQVRGRESLEAIGGFREETERRKKAKGSTLR